MRILMYNVCGSDQDSIHALKKKTVNNTKGKGIAKVEKVQICIQLLRGRGRSRLCLGLLKRRLDFGQIAHHALVANFDDVLLIRVMHAFEC
jgi:hypothetical protein